MPSSTSGTTGEPLTFRYTASLRAAHQAHVAIAASMAAPELTPWLTRFIVARARPVRGLSATGVGGSLVLSASSLHRPDILGRLVDAYRPEALFGNHFPAARLADALGTTYRLRAAILASESLLPGLLRAVERIADTVIVTYGMAEGAAFALRCPSCQAYGETSSHALLTLRPRPEGMFDIIGTAFWSLGTLFIAYETGDLTAGTTDPCPDCPPGGLRLAGVLGRSHDTLINLYGLRRALAGTVCNNGVLATMTGVRLYDCLQGEAGRVVVRYATEHGQPIDEGAALRALRYVASDVAFELRFEPRLLAMRDELPPGAKWRLIKPIESTPGVADAHHG